MKIDARPFRDPQQSPPAAHCDECGGELYCYDTVFHYDGKTMCRECFAERISTWVREYPYEIAAVLGVEMEEI